MRDGKSRSLLDKRGSVVDFPGGLKNNQLLNAIYLKPELVGKTESMYEDSYPDIIKYIEFGKYTDTGILGMQPSLQWKQKRKSLEKP
jgi:hypothetical protein